MKQHHKIILAFFAAFLINIIFSANADAAICKDDVGKDVEGFSVALVYCVQKSISDAVLGTNGGIGYLPKLLKLMSPYTYAAITLALCFYGIKLSTRNVKDLLQEGSTVLFKIAIVLFLLQSLVGNTVYNGGLYRWALHASNVLVSLVNTGFMHATASCTAKPPLPSGVDPISFQTWQAFDCMFASIAGVATNGSVIMGSLLAILMASLFSGALGVALLIAGITAILSIIFTLMRAIYLFLLAYFMIAFLMIISPVIIPLIVFDIKLTREMFWKWTSMLGSAIIQPMFIIGFLSFSVMIEASFIEGSNPSCVLPQFNQTTGETISEGSGVCSFKQLILGKQNVDGLSISNKDIDDKMEHNSKLVEYNVNADPSSHGWWDKAKQTLQEAKDAVVNKWQQFSSASGFLSFFGFTRIKLPFPFKELIVTMFAYLIVSVCMRQLLNKIPSMAQSITAGSAIQLGALAKPPLNTIATAVKSFGDEMKKQARGKRGLDGVGSIAEGGAKGVLASIRRTGENIEKNW